MTTMATHPPFRRSPADVSSIRLVPAKDMAVVRALFTEYADSLGLDLSFQGFEEELAGLPGRYAAPDGAIFLSEVDGEAVGCVAVRPLAGPGGCEMKRLYVRAGWTGHGLGRRLAEAAIAAARERRYTVMRLDTLTSMTEANILYNHLGFRRIEPYYRNPLPGALFYELSLLSLIDA